MTVTRRAITAAAGLGLLVAACTSASHLPGLQPPQPTSSSTPSPTPSPAPARPPMQLGADIDMYTYPGQNIPAVASADVAYIRSLHANAVSVSFPIFMHGTQGSAVYARPSTPSPGELATVAAAAERAGLFVSIRPLLDEGSLGRSRVGWKPRHPAAWFAAYQRFLLPYAVMAQRAGIREFIVGAEFTAFGHSPHWVTLDAALRRVFHGTLAYANNGNTIHRGAGGKGVVVTVDAYPRLGVLPGAPPGALERAWADYDRALPAGAVLTETGIAAVRGAYALPWAHHWPGAAIDPGAQARWFTAACHAAVATHLGGIYFWSIGFSTHLAGPSNANQGAWAHSAGGRAIRACFGHVDHG